jgi:two-component system chemotaxis sensor kinase CheA
VDHRREEYLDIYFEEVEGLLQDLDERLNGLRHRPTDAANLETLRRVAHTIKSSAGLMGFEETKAFARELESVMKALEVGRVEPSSVVDLVCASFQFLRATSAELKNTGRENQSAIAEKTRDLENLLLHSN